MHPPESAPPRAPYEFNRSPYGSHAMLLAALPAEGRGCRVLDLGCAGGYLASTLAGRGYRVVGVDRQGAVAGTPTFDFVPGDLDGELPALGGPFDFVVLADVLEHLKEPRRLLHATRRLLAPGGAVFASLPNSGHLYFRLVVLLGRFPAHDRGLFDRTHLRFFTLSGWRELFERAGMRFERLDATGIPFGRVFPKFESSSPVRAAEWSNRILARAWKRLFAYQFIVRAIPGDARPRD